MKQIRRSVDKTGLGSVVVCPEDDEDMWHLYNLIQPGDEVKALALRRVVQTGATGSTSSERVRTKLTIQVTNVHFTPSSASGGASASGPSTSDQHAAIQVSGRVSQENNFVKMGSYHTLDLEPNRDVTIIKQEWDSISLGRVEEACVEGRGADLGAIVLSEGTAAICLLSEHMTVVRQRIEVPVPRKRMGSSTLHDKGAERFYQAVYQAFLRHIPFSDLRAIVLASPGFVKDTLYDYIFAEATRTNNKALLQSRSKFLRIHTSSSHVHSLVEVLKSPEITNLLKETKFAKEGIMLDKFFKMLASDELRAWYGPDHVLLAADRGAIGTLLITDELFRSNKVEERKKYVALVESVKQKGGEVLIFSSMHESGQQLNQLTGIAAILTFPLDVEVVEAEEKAAKEEAELARLEAEGEQQPVAA
ncbi:Translation factor pelota [Tulasnella sp. 424]|nr:Translation factor pelota [Tulasnella sp. 424]KAG8973813.1 Translation factor pelota [Tulasnella sp. 425]